MKKIFKTVDLGAKLTKEYSNKLQIQTSSEAIEENAYLNDIVKYNGTYYKVGIGEAERETIKVKRKKYIIPLLYAICYKENEEELDVDLCLMLPRNQMGTAREYGVLKNKFECEVNGVHHVVKITNIYVFPEGQCGYYALGKELRKKDLLVVDIGGSTTDCSLYFNKKEQTALSIPVGVINFYDSIVNVVANDKDNPVSYSAKKIEALFKNPKQKNHLEKKYPKIMDIEERFINNIEVNIKEDLAAFSEVDTVVFIGGGSETLRATIEEVPNALILEEQQNIFANCIGASKICKGKGLIK